MAHLSMSSTLKSFLFLTFTLTLLTSRASALRNITLEDSDPSIVWTGSWARVGPGFGNPKDGANTYMTTRSREAFAEFRFTGIAVYFVAPRFPYRITTRLTLSPVAAASAPPTNSTTSSTIISLEDYATKSTDSSFGQRVVLASASGLEVREWVVRVDVDSSPSSVSSEDDGPYAFFDAFIYTTLDEGEAPPSPSPSSQPRFTQLPESQISPFPFTSSSSSPTTSQSPNSNTPAPQPPSTSTLSSSSSSSASSIGLTPMQLSILFIFVFLLIFFGCCAGLAWKYRLVRRIAFSVDGESSSAGSTSANGATGGNTAGGASNGQNKPRVVSEDLTQKMYNALCEKQPAEHGGAVVYASHERGAWEVSEKRS